MQQHLSHLFLCVPSLNSACLLGSRTWNEHCSTVQVQTFVEKKKEEKSEVSMSTSNWSDNYSTKYSQKFIIPSVSNIQHPDVSETSSMQIENVHSVE